VMDKS